MISGTHALMAKLLYGAGLRLMEYAFGECPGLSKWTFVYHAG
jgi:hypothetical protein